MKHLLLSFVCSISLVILFSCGKAEHVVNSIFLDKSELVLLSGESYSLKATVKPHDSVTWTSTRPEVVSVENGVLTAVALEGTSLIIASAGGKCATCFVTVVNIPAESVSLNKTSITLFEGEAEQLVATVSPDNATIKGVVWKSTNPEVVIVGQDGKITAVSKGIATVYAEVGEISASCQVIVDRKYYVKSLSLDKILAIMTEGDTERLTTTVLPENASDKTVVWDSSDNSVAVVDQNGTITALSYGLSTIVAKAGEKTATCMVIVNRSDANVKVSLDKTDMTLREKEISYLFASVLPEDASNKSITWISSNPSIASVDNDGRVTGIKAGTTMIIAKADNGGYMDACVVSVSKAYISGHEDLNNEEYEY